MNDSLRKPNLFIIGAMKSGTSSLHAWLGAHPEIFMCEPKEPCYFVDREELNWPYIEQQGFWRGEEPYLSLFENAGDAAIVGESSTHYSKAPSVHGVPERIARFNPDARFIYLMRDPVQRTISHYWHAVINDGETRDMLSAICHDKRYRDVSYYAMQLQPYFERFGRDRVLVLTFEKLVANTEAMVRAVFTWLGVESEFVPTNLCDRSNVTPKHFQQVRGRGYLHRFRHHRLWNAIGPLVPSSMRQWGRRLAAKHVDRTAQPTDQVIGYLRPIQREQVIELSELLGQSFDEWKTIEDRATRSHESVSQNP